MLNSPHDQCMCLIPWPSVSFRDQSCTDILDLYYRLKYEHSSGGEARVSVFVSLVIFIFYYYCFIIRSAATLLLRICMCSSAGWLGCGLWHSRNIYRTSGKEDHSPAYYKLPLELKSSAGAWVLVGFPYYSGREQIQIPRSAVWFWMWRRGEANAENFYVGWPPRQIQDRLGSQWISLSIR